MWIERLDAWVIALTFGAAMFASWTLGRRWAQRSSSLPARDTSTRFTDASMALLGLLLAFTFAITLNRNDDRRQAIVTESNAIGDFYTCASLLSEPSRSMLQAVLLDYARHKLDVMRGSSLEIEPERVIQQSLDLHARATDIVAEAVARGTPIANALVNTLNDVTSSHAAYLAAYRERLPVIVLVLLLLGSVIPAFLMGQQAPDTVHVSGPISFGVLVTAVIYVTFDLNQPASGLITMNQESLVHLIQSMVK
jgi:hypothetical protein